MENEKRDREKIAPPCTAVADVHAVEESIRARIFTIRGVPVMLDRDLAVLYDVSTSRLNEQVKRNKARFPAAFMFQLSREEMTDWISQIATSNRYRSVKMGLRRQPYAFTEHGIVMLASVLKSAIAVKTGIQITHAFVSMRRTLASMAPMLARIETVERRQVIDRARTDANQARNEERFETIFKAMGEGDFPPQKVFFDGHHYDAYSFARKLVRAATKRLVLVDGYCDDVTLDILSCKRGGTKALIATAAQTPITATAIAKFNRQNPTLEVTATSAFHDRFLILDDAELYHFGASLKDLGRRYCAVSKMDAAFIPSILARV